MRHSSLAILGLAQLAAALAPTGNLSIVQTAEKTSDRLSPQPSAHFKGDAPSQGKAVLEIDLDKRRQIVDGFGGAITDSSAYVFSKLNKTLQAEVVELLWGPSGQKYNLGRLTIGATDFSTSQYSYDTVDGDYTMQNFSIAHDLDEIIPLALRASAASGGALEFLASPWSPPAWLKQNKHMRNSDSPGLVQDPKAQTAYALYVSKYVSNVKAQGVNLTRLTVQNEPHVKGQFAETYPCCGFDGGQERDFVRDYLGPRLRADHPDVQLFVHDDQKDIMIDRVKDILGDSNASQYVDGVAFHWYGDNLKNYQFLEQLHTMYPSMPLLATEATLESPAAQHIGTSPWKEAQKYAVDIIGDLNAWTRGWIEWNVLLDASGGPTCVGPSVESGCAASLERCDAPILADAGKQTIEVRDSYWFMGHFSRYIPRGSVVVDVKPNDSFDLNATAVVTPEQELVVVVLNTDSSDSKKYHVRVGDQYAKIEIPAHGIQTLKVSLQ